MDNRAVKFAAEKHPELIPEPYGEIVGQVGVEAVYVLYEFFGGFHHYVPSPRAIFRECVLAQVREERDGGASVRDLAKKYGYTYRHLQKALARMG